jgi:predicted DNA binding CopG/RHH family protein
LILISLSDKYQRLFTSINSLSSTGESNSIPGRKKKENFHNINIFVRNLECTNEAYKSVLERNGDLERENDRIQRLNTSLQSRIHEITLRVKSSFCFSSSYFYDFKI